MSEVARLLCQAIELRAVAGRAGGHAASSQAFDCSAAMIDEATPLGARRLANDGTHEWDVVVLCGGVLTLFGVHRPMSDDERQTMRMAQIAEAEGGE